MLPIENSYLHNETFRDKIEQHMVILISKSSRVQITPVDSYRFTGDFYGLMAHLGVPLDYHWITMRANALHSSIDFEGTTMEIIVPDRNYIESLLQKHASTTSFF